MLRYRLYRPVGCRQRKLAMLPSSNTRVAKVIGGVQRHEKCLAGWMKRSKVSRLNLTVFGCVFLPPRRSAGPDPIATVQF